MNCVLFAKMDQVFSLGNRTLKKYWKNGKKYWKSQGKVREFCQSRKVGTLCIFPVVGQVGNRVEQYQFNGVPFVTFDSGSAE